MSFYSQKRSEKISALSLVRVVHLVECLPKLLEDVEQDGDEDDDGKQSACAEAAFRLPNWNMMRLRV